MVKLNQSILEKGIEAIVSTGGKRKATKVFYQDMIKRIQKREISLNKYYYEFRYDEIIKMLEDWEITTVNSIKTMNTILSKYLEFYIEEGLADIKYSTFLRTEDLIDLVYDDNEQLYFTSDIEFKMFVQSFCQNSQDSVIFSLLYEGVNGIRSQEIRNLREEDVDFDNNILKVKQDNKDGLEEVRTVRASSLLMDTIYDALHDDLYYKNNGQASESNKTEYFEIESNGFVVRNSGRTSYEAVKPHIITQRVKKLAEHYGKSKLNPKNVMNSGMIMQLKKIEVAKGLVTNEDIKRVHEKYNLNPNTWYSTKKLYDNVGSSFTVSE